MSIKFNSQICTSREQSERLLALGLKRETADMHYSVDHRGNVRQLWLLSYGDLHEDVQVHSLPAWSLHRLLCLYGQDYEIKELYNSAEECYGMLITAIGRAIENEEFNEEYLNNGVYTH